MLEPLGIESTYLQDHAGQFFCYTCLRQATRALKAELQNRKPSSSRLQSGTAICSICGQSRECVRVSLNQPAAREEPEHDVPAREADTRERAAELCESNEPPKSVTSRPVQEEPLPKPAEQSEGLHPDDSNLLRDEIKGRTAQPADPPRLADEGQSGE